MPADQRTEVGIRQTDVDELREHGQGLFRAHFQESSPFRETDSLEVDWRGYYALEEQDRLICFAAWHDGELIGYVVNVLVPDLHNGGSVFCQNDALFVAEWWRGMRVGHDLLARTAQMAAKLGCTRVLGHALPQTALDKLLPRLGYTLIATLWSKEL